MRWWTTFLAASRNRKGPAGCVRPGPCGVSATRAVQAHRDRAVHDDGDEVATAAAVSAADHRHEFGPLPWVSHIGDHAVLKRCAPHAVDLHVEALGLQQADGGYGGVGC